MKLKTSIYKKNIIASSVILLIGASAAGTGPVLPQNEEEGELRGQVLQYNIEGTETQGHFLDYENRKIKK